MSIQLAKILKCWEKEPFHYNKAKFIPYKFKLIYRANKDGNTVAKFHEKCDNKGATIVIIKVTNSEQIIGGYNPLQWDSSCSDHSTKDSFIFSFTSVTNLQSAKVGYSKGDKYSIRCGINNGPSFGSHSGDLWCNKGTWSSESYSYPNLDIPSSFNVDDYKVFQVTKK